jgi:hypothetical protein
MKNVLKKELNAMAKAEPNLAEVNRPIQADPDPNAVSRTVDIEHALAVLRSENAWLKDCAKTNAEREARNEETRKKNSEGWRRENLRLQEQLLASQEKV